MEIPQWLEQAIMTYGYWAILVAVALETMGIPVPGETAIIAGAVLAGTGHALNIVAVIAVAAAGAILGDNLGYSIGRYGGARLVRRYGRFLGLTEERLRYGKDYFARHGDKTVFLGRFVAILRIWVAFLAGLNHMPWPRFLFWNALGGIAWALVMGLLGYFLGRNLTLLDDIVLTLGWGGLAIFAALVMGAIALNIWRRRKEHRRWKA